MLERTSSGKWQLRINNQRASQGWFGIRWQREREFQRAFALPLPGEWSPPLEGVSFRWELRSLEGGLALTFSLRNGGREPLRVEAVYPLVLELGLVPRGERERWHFFRHGFQSWSLSGWFSFAEKPPRPWLKSFTLANFHVDSLFYRKRQGLLGHLFAAISTPERHFLTLDFVSQRRALGEFFLEPQRGRLWAVLDYGGKVLPPGAELRGETLWLKSAAQPEFETFLELLGREMEARVPDRGLRGWCSWYAYGPRISAEQLRTDLKELQERQIPLDVFQIDDGYQRAVGDWLEMKQDFWGELSPLVKEIRRAQMQPGLWLAPFLAAGNSRLFRQHREWVLRDSRGKPVYCGFNPNWRARTYTLDLSHPEVREHLVEVFQRRREEGFTYFKLDFLFAGLRKGRRQRPELSPVEVYRQTLRQIRTACPDAWLAGCGAPLGPSVGLFESMRVSPDVAPFWRNRLWERPGQGCGVPSLKFNLRENLYRAACHRRLWLNDPDCLVLREQESRLEPHHRRWMTTAAAVTGSLVFLSDPPKLLPPDTADRLAELPLQAHIRPLGILLPKHPPAVWLENGDHALYYAVNLGKNNLALNVPAGWDRARWFDYFQQRPAAFPESLEAGEAVCLLGSRANERRPVIIGTDQAPLALVQGLLKLEITDGGRVVVRCAKGVREAGVIWLELPGEISLRAEPQPGFSINRAGKFWRLAVKRRPPWEWQFTLESKEMRQGNRHIGL